MNHSYPGYPSVTEMLRHASPVDPVYCIYPHVVRDTASRFLDGFPGRVLYAVKANNDARLLEILHASGIRDFDCASVAEIALVREVCPDATCYFMVPVRLRGAARTARQEFGVDHFMIDHESGLRILGDEIELPGTVVFVRMAVHHASAMIDLSSKFGAPPAEVAVLLQRVAESGAEPALAFNVGSAVVSDAAYRYAIERAAEVLDSLPFKVRLVDVGGGYPVAYPGFDVPDLDAYFDAIRDASTALPIAAGGELLAEPGRAIAAPGMSAVVEVLLRKNDRLYINDGMYGIFWELRCKGHDRYPLRVFRDGNLHHGPTSVFTLYGPTCDSTDVLPGKVSLPADIREGDYVEFGRIGAYSLAGRTDFNGFYSDSIVEITAETERPPQDGGC